MIGPEAGVGINLQVSFSGPTGAPRSFARFLGRSTEGLVPERCWASEQLQLSGSRPVPVPPG